ncbi:FBXW4-like protein [Mya arenaria]|uniref:FBXW4-like protein n=1 Tax=Mya arenaria TaxID=6604 RepID=A0ABY7FG75_MYAAR|nr:FBXW4-like protein [Mya arenaria]
MDFQSKTTQAEGKIPHPSICLEIIPELPDVALIYIFKKCDIKTLGRICRACKRFRDLVKLDAVWFRFSRYLLKLNSCDIGSKRLIPWMQYNQNVLWISGKNGIRSFDVRETGRPRERKGKRLQLPNRHDVTRFVVTSVTGTGDQDCGPIKAVLNLRERVWSLALAQGGRNVAIGTAGCRGAPSLSVWNVESVSEWAEPYDATVYCLQTDCNVAMVTGTAQHSMVRLWDKRSTQPVQEYFLSQKSPVYSVAFDSRRLFAALDLNTSYLDFS